MRLSTCAFSFIYSISLKSLLFLDFGLFWWKPSMPSVDFILNENLPKSEYWRDCTDYRFLFIYLTKKHGNKYFSCVSVRLYSILYIQSLWKVCFFLILHYSGKNRVCYQLIPYSMRTYLNVNNGENAPITDSCLLTLKRAWKKYTSHASQYVCILFYVFNLSEKYASSWFRIVLVKTEYTISWFHTVWELT